MEKQLQEIVTSLEVISNVANMDDANPIVHRLSNSSIRRVTTVVCAVREPSGLILPLNVLWVDFNPLSRFYKQMLRRVSKEPDAALGTAHTWETIETMAEYEADQAYDAEDSPILQAESPIPLATAETVGVARLSVPPISPTNPIAVGEGDPRLSDPREPLEHTHPEKPATQLKTKSGVISINQSVAPVPGATLVATSETTAMWRQLTTNDVQ